MPYKISGTKSETARIIVFKENDWSIEANTVISGSGTYEIDSLVSGTKTVAARSVNGYTIGYGNVTGEYYAPLARGVFAGGNDGAVTNVIQYITIASEGNAQNFGDLTVARTWPVACSNSTNERGVFFDAGYDHEIIDYITISTLGDAISFGSLPALDQGDSAACDNGVNDRGIFANYDNIYYVTISTPGNSTNFGTKDGRRSFGSCSNDTNNRGIFAGGYSYTNDINYIDISSTGNAQAFGDLVLIQSYSTGTSNGTNERGIFAGGLNAAAARINIIQYITISSLGDATNFGDLSEPKLGFGFASNKTSERAVLGGGSTPTKLDVMEYITISTLSDASDFGDLMAANANLSATSNA